MQEMHSQCAIDLGPWLLARWTRTSVNRTLYRTGNAEQKGATFSRTFQDYFKGYLLVDPARRVPQQSSVLANS